MKRTLISALVAGCVGLASFAAAAGTVVVNGSTTVCLPCKNQRNVHG